MWMARWDDDFLVDLEPLVWSRPDGAPEAITPSVLFLGQGDYGLEVAVATSERRPTAEQIRKLWTARQGGRPSPLLLVVGYPEQGEMKVTVCGPAGEHPALTHGLSVSQVERLAAAALAEPSRHAAVRFLVAMLPEAESDLPGIRNAGLLATQELRQGVPERPDWPAACKRGAHLLALHGRKLVEGLGFEVDALSTHATVLKTGNGNKRAVAIFLDEGEAFDAAAERLAGTSPVSHALARADAENLPWVVLTRGRQIRLYAARADTGVGRKGRAETFVEVNLALLPEGQAGYLPLLFGSDALSEHGTIEDILERSADFAAGLAARLRERVYFDTVPALATAVAARLGDSADLDEQDLARAYEQTLVILFRLLFVAYAEDKDLLPYRSNSRYADHSLKRITRGLAEGARSGTARFDTEAIDLWEDIRQLWRAVDKGNTGWGVPGYNGGLFSADPDTSPAGAALAAIELTDAELGPALTSMLVDEGEDGVLGPVDFRSLSVREFGTIYEGLLESMLSIAPDDLTTDARGNYVPATKSTDEVLVAAGEVYFHHRSGARKATGSYFTKPFAVEHLLDHALEPALDDHLARIEAHLADGDEAAAADAFFDFRCADIAMGSGHFLVAAVDRIEARLSGFLALHPIPLVTAELDTLRQAALDALGDLADAHEIETASLLRRQVARRCVYGVDLNHISVELARLAIWIHTFVPGLPLSFLDHSLICGNSLTGIGTLDEALQILDPSHGGTGQVSLFRNRIEGFLDRATSHLTRLAAITEATTTDITQAREAHQHALTAVEPARQLFDLLVALRLGEAKRLEDVDEATLGAHPSLPRAEALVADLHAVHFPIRFPEVFLRPQQGFDCILGNPPWEKLHVEEHAFWGLRFPGLRGLPVARMNKEVEALRLARPDLVREYEAEVDAVHRVRDVLAVGPYPDLGASHPDLYKAFSWRFWELVGLGGCIGVVLPRAAMASAGMTTWRRTLLDEGDFMEVMIGTNSAGWMFDDAEFRYTICLVSIRRTGEPDDEIAMHGPFRSLAAYRTGMNQGAVVLPAAGVREWTTGASLPLIPGPDAGRVFLKLREQPRLDDDEGFSFRPVQGDLNATTGKKHMILDPEDTERLWPVYKGGSFNLWTPRTGDVYAWVDPETIVGLLRDKRASAASKSNSVWYGMPTDWLTDPDSLPCLHPRIAFRDVARATDSRTVIAALVPGHVVVNHKAPYLLRKAGDERDEAFLLGVLSSLPFDWYGRRLVENSVTFDLLNAFPVPRPDPLDPLRLRVIDLAGRLAAVDDAFSTWADAVGVSVASINSAAQRADTIAELDAAVSRLYGLTGDDLKVIYETFHEGWDCTERLSAVLAHFEEMA